MGEIYLGFVKCKDCGEGFPVEAKTDCSDERKNLKKIPKYCPFCGSQNLNFDDLWTKYYG